MSEESMGIKYQNEIEKFRTQVHDRSTEIDSGEEHNWHSLSLGFFLGLGLEPKEASSLATYVRYRTNLG